MVGSSMSWLPGWVPNWFLYALAGLLFLGALWNMLSIILGSRKRPARSCPKCWYDMSKTAGLQCPECGHTAKSERTLHRRRIRRFRWATLALALLLASIPVALMPHTRVHGWLSVVPTRVLAWLLPLQSQSQEITQLLVLRFVHGSPPGPFGPHTPELDDLERVLSCFARGVPLARPPSQRWMESYGSAIRQLFGLLVQRRSDGTWLASPSISGRWGSSKPSTYVPMQSKALTAAIQDIIDLPYIPGEVRTRSVWPLDRPLAINAPIMVFWPTPYVPEQLMSFSANDGPWSTPQRFYGSATIDFAGSESTKNPTTLRIRVEVSRHGGTDPKDRVSLGFYERTLTVRFAEPGQAAITPVDDPKLTALLAGGLVRVEGSAGVSIDVLAVASGGPFAGTPFQGVALGGTLELLCDGKVVLINRLRTALGTNQVTATGEFPPDSSPLVLSDLLAEERSNPSFPVLKHKWTARLRSDPNLALDIVEADRYWSGTLELPVKIAPD